MAKKKMTRDIPLPSSDGMFGGPGDPKKKYTASDSANYMGTYNRQQASFKKAYESMNSMMENSKRDRRMIPCAKIHFIQLLRLATKK
jgi:hypothetical protein